LGFYKAKAIWLKNGLANIKLLRNTAIQHIWISSRKACHWMEIQVDRNSNLTRILGLTVLLKATNPRLHIMVFLLILFCILLNFH